MVIALWTAVVGLKIELSSEEKQRTGNLFLNAFDDDRNMTYKRRFLEAFLSGLSPRRKQLPLGQGNNRDLAWETFIEPSMPTWVLRVNLQTIGLLD